MTSDTAGPAAPGRGLHTALMASLALNVLIIGGVAGAFLFGHHGWHERGPKGSLLLGFARTLPSDRADMVRKKIEAGRPELESLRKAERDARDAARDQLVAEPFDPAKLKAALDAAGAADAKEKSARLALFAATVSELTPEERRQLHDWLVARRKGRGD